MNFKPPDPMLENTVMRALRNLLLNAGLLLTFPVLHAAEPTKEDSELANNLVSSIANVDYAGFIANNVDPATMMTEEKFAAVAGEIRNRLKVRDTLTYLGDLKQEGCHVTLWRLTFKDGSDDFLLTLRVKNRKIFGFLIR